MWPGTRIIIATTAMVCQLVVAIPLSYFIAFKAGRWELPMLLLLVLVDELNPIVRIYAWRMLLGREGLINDTLQWLGIIDKPLDWLLFTKFSVILVLSTSWVNYCALPIYASMKAIKPQPVRGGHRPRRRLGHALAPRAVAARGARASSWP